MYQNHQDMIDDFLNAITGDCNPTEQKVETPIKSSSNLPKVRILLAG